MKRLITISLLTAAAFAFPVVAEEEKAEVLYWDLDPNVTTNYQKPSSRKLGFITIDVQLQVRGAEQIEILDEHQPLIENVVVDIIHSLAEQQVKDQTARATIREEIKTQLAAVFLEEVGKEVVEDVYFTKFFYQ